MKTTAALILAIFLSACALPNTTVRAGSVRPTLAVKGAPPDAVLYIDGLAAGAAAELDGVAKVLYLEEGAHRVEVRTATRILYAEKIYVSSGEGRVVDVGGGNNER